MVLNCRRELLVCMVNHGILQVIGDICVSETDQLVLVCLLHFSFLSFIYLPLVLFIQNVTLMLSSSMVVQLGMVTKDRKAMTRAILGNILSMIMVCTL